MARLTDMSFFESPSFRASPAYASPPPAFSTDDVSMSMDEDAMQMDESVVSYYHRGAPSVRTQPAASAPVSACECDLSAYEYDATGYAAGERWPDLGSLYDDTCFPELNSWAALVHERERQERKPFAVQDNAPPRALKKRPSNDVGLQMREQSKHSRGEHEQRW